MYSNEQRKQQQKVYGRGFYDGMKAAEEQMTPAKFEKAMRGQSSIASKVYNAVPTAQAWSSTQIYGALGRATNARPDISIVRGCINSLIAAGVVREIEADRFQRVRVRKSQPSEDSNGVMPETSTGGNVSSSQGRPTLVLATQREEQKPDGVRPSPIDLLAVIAGRLSDIGKQVTAIVSDLENAALVIEEGITEHTENFDKLHQLQALLKSLA